MPLHIFNFSDTGNTPVKSLEVKKQPNQYEKPQSFEDKKNLLENFEKTILTMKDSGISLDSIMDIIKKHYNQ